MHTFATAHTHVELAGLPQHVVNSAKRDAATVAYTALALSDAGSARLESVHGGHEDQKQLCSQYPRHG